jgi:hypothetical protein
MVDSESRGNLLLRPAVDNCRWICYVHSREREIRCRPLAGRRSLHGECVTRTWTGDSELKVRYKVEQEKRG